jgi:hypothetical protein
MFGRRFSVRSYLIIVGLCLPSGCTFLNPSLIWTHSPLGTSPVSLYFHISDFPTIYSLQLLSPLPRLHPPSLHLPNMTFDILGIFKVLAFGIWTLLLRKKERQNYWLNLLIPFFTPGVLVLRLIWRPEITSSL